jgi:SAM-dependent methyltransferase
MVERFLERGLLSGARYQLTDAEPELLALARERLAARFQPAGEEAKQSRAKAGEGEHTARGEVTAPPLRLEREEEGAGAGALAVHFETVVVEDLPDPPADTVDLVVAHALLDLVDLDRALGPLLAQLRPGGLLYASLTFDGFTAFEPPVQRGLDERVLAAYHRSMEREGRPGPAAGRALEEALQRRGMELLASGSSTWNVPADPAGPPTSRERTFLATLLAFFRQALVPGEELSERQIERWLAGREEMLEAGKTHLIATHRDLLALKPDLEGA